MVSTIAPGHKLPAAVRGSCQPPLVIFDLFTRLPDFAAFFRGIKIAVGILILDAAVKMLRKMQKKPMPLAFMLCAFAAMLLINIFSVRISSIVLMLTCGLISLVIFMVKRPAAKGGAGK